MLLRPSLRLSFSCCVDRTHLHSFPTRRSSDLVQVRPAGADAREGARGRPFADREALDQRTVGRQDRQDRKSTRLNSSHGYISYAVFCLKKKTPTNEIPTSTTPANPASNGRSGT